MEDGGGEVHNGTSILWPRVIPYATVSDWQTCLIKFAFRRNKMECGMGSWSVGLDTGIQTPRSFTFRGDNELDFLFLEIVYMENEFIWNSVWVISLQNFNVFCNGIFFSNISFRCLQFTNNIILPLLAIYWNYNVSYSAKEFE